MEESSQMVYEIIKWLENIDNTKIQINYYDAVHRTNIIVGYNKWIPFEDGGKVPLNLINSFMYDYRVTLWDKYSKQYKKDILRQGI